MTSTRTNLGVLNPGPEIKPITLAILNVLVVSQLVENSVK